MIKKGIGSSSGKTTKKAKIKKFSPNFMWQNMFSCGSTFFNLNCPFCNHTR
jgi:hypothetical protein